MSSLTNKLTQWVKKVVNSATVGNAAPTTRKFVGKDVKGNSYYSEIMGGRERRTVEYSADYDKSILHLPQDLPLEWVSWLKYMRDHPPTEKESKILDEYRERLKANGEKWDQEQQRQALQSQANEGMKRTGLGGSRYGSTNDDTYSGSDKPPSFQFIADRLRQEGSMSSDAESLANEVENSERSQNINISRVLTSSGELKSTHSSQDLEQLQNSERFNKFERTDNTPKDPYAHLIPDARLKRSRTDADMQAIIDRENKEYDIPKDLSNPSNLSQEDIRNITRMYSRSRTSPFLGKKPQIRANSNYKVDE
ncbi:hypothetical protein C9374_009329 [Naegleria lovaniensis]|uniref:NADH dehydrogenase [ubiquinone] 1 alpha subcomplex subunit 12 n=1 Tax=Naegleria lovaniensis TaxID=51637 RepID=A0AA88GF93_NAELO|nr:uncharacterized protein C9374_009329 [Naegleria lovaniensis]KAG2377418.1 hypothetical protein C9374_009329 [Naegleria lovaniensis]